MKVNVSNETVSKGIVMVGATVLVTAFVVGIFGLVSYGLAFVISYFSGRPLDNQLWLVCLIVVLVVEWIFTRVTILKE